MKMVFAAAAAKQHSPIWCTKPAIQPAIHPPLQQYSHHTPLSLHAMPQAPMIQNGHSSQPHLAEFFKANFSIFCSVFDAHVFYSHFAAFYQICVVQTISFGHRPNN